MQNEFDEEIREFLIESNESLAVLDQQIVELEKDPENVALISSIFRTMHSIKGTCGFFGFDILGAVTHRAESILGQLRERQRVLTPGLISLILEAVDAVKALLARIEATGAEGADESEALRERLDTAFREGSAGDLMQDMLQAAEKKREAEAGTAAAAPVTAAPAIAVPVTVAPAPAQQRPEPSAPAVVQNAVPSPTIAATPAIVAAAPNSASATHTTKPETESVPKPEAEKTTTDSPADLNITDATIRVDVNLLNQLMNLVGELVLTRNQLLQAASTFSPAVQQTSQRLNVITTELQEGVMKTRMQPIGVIWNKLPRVVRDLSSKCGKQIEIEMLGAETELDKSLIEAIRDPLTHIVRNSCDHGIETPAERQKKGKPPTGKLCLRAFHEAGAVNIEISDDGAGIDPDKVRSKAIEKRLITPDQAAAMSRMEAVNLIFLPGFSTAAQITSLSGRGVGMDVVKTNIEKISGSVDVVLLPEGGTAIKIKIPLTLAIIPGLIVSSNARSGQQSQREDRFVIPQSHLVEMTRVDLSAHPSMVETVHGATIFRHRGKLLPLVYLSHLLKRADGHPTASEINIIVLQVAGLQFGLVVDRICDTQEIVVKPLGQQLKHLICYGGATIMGDGQPALILDVGGIAKLAGLDAKNPQRLAAATAAKSSAITSEFLLFRAGQHTRIGLPLSIVNRLEEVPVHKLEQAAGEAVLPYRGELLPLFSVAALLEERSGVQVPAEGEMKVIVINDGDRRAGLLVDEIVDIVEGSIDMMRSSTRPAILGSAVIGGAVTDLLDVLVIQGNAHRRWSRVAATDAYTRRVALCDEQPLSREMLHTLLASAGYLHTEAGSTAQLRAALSDGGLDAVVVVDHGTGVPAWWVEANQADPRLARIPRVVLRDAPSSAPAMQTPLTNEWVVDRHDRAELLRTLDRIALCDAELRAA